MDKQVAEYFIGKEVWIYPNDTYKKRGIVEAVDDLGILILITFEGGSRWAKTDYTVGKKRYIPLNRIVLEEY